MPFTKEYYTNEKINITNTNTNSCTNNTDEEFQIIAKKRKYELSQFRCNPYNKERKYRKHNVINHEFSSLLKDGKLPLEIKTPLLRNKYLDLSQTISKDFFASSIYPELVQQAENYFKYTNIKFSSKKYTSNIIILPKIFGVANGKKYLKYQPSELELIPIVSFYKLISNNCYDDKNNLNKDKHYIVFTLDKTIIDLESKKYMYIFINELMNLPENKKTNIYFEDLLKNAHQYPYNVIFVDNKKNIEHILNDQNKECFIYDFLKESKDNLDNRHRKNKDNFHYHDQTEQSYYLDFYPENNELLSGICQVYDSIETRARNTIDNAIMKLGEKIDFQIKNNVYS